jgi:hypothetical protein
MGRIFDDRGNRMTPSYARKGGKRYRYYLSSALSNGQAEHAGAVRRVPASEIETIVIEAVRKHGDCVRHHAFLFVPKVSSPGPKAHSHFYDS